MHAEPPVLFLHTLFLGLMMLLQAAAHIDLIPSLSGVVRLALQVPLCEFVKADALSTLQAFGQSDFSLLSAGSSGSRGSLLPALDCFSPDSLISIRSSV